MGNSEGKSFNKHGQGDQCRGNKICLIVFLIMLVMMVVWATISTLCSIFYNAKVGGLVFCCGAGLLLLSIIVLLVLKNHFKLHHEDNSLDISPDHEEKDTNYQVENSFGICPECEEKDINYQGNYSLGYCPFCSMQGLLRLVKYDNGEIYIGCDEAYHEFNSMEDVKNKKLRGDRKPYILNDDFLSLEEAIKKGYKEYIFVFKDNQWKKLK